MPSSIMLDAPPTDNSFVSASLTGRGGTVRADIRLEGPRRDRIREVLLTGDFFVTPPRMVFDLEAALRGVNVAEAGSAIEAFFARTRGRLPQPERRRFSPGDRHGAARQQRHRGGKLTQHRCAQAALTLAEQGVYILVSACDTEDTKNKGGKP